MFVPYICGGTPVVQASAEAFSPPQDAQLPQCSTGVDTLASAARFDLSSPHSRVSVRIHNTDDGTPPPAQLVGVDGNNSTVATASAMAPNGGWATLTLAQPAGQAPRITRVFLSRDADGGNRLDIDDLTLDYPRRRAQDRRARHAGPRAFKRRKRPFTVLQTDSVNERKTATKKRAARKRKARARAKARRQKRR